MPTGQGPGSPPEPQKGFGEQPGPPEKGPATPAGLGNPERSRRPLRSSNQGIFRTVCGCPAAPDTRHPTILNPSNELLEVQRLVWFAASGGIPPHQPNSRFLLGYVVIVVGCVGPVSGGLPDTRSCPKLNPRHALRGRNTKCRVVGSLWREAGYPVDPRRHEQADA